MNKLKRQQVVKAMEIITRQINDEDVLERWLVYGVADGDIGESTPIEEVDKYYIEDDNFADLMETFLDLMVAAKKSGGLYADGVVSKYTYPDDEE